MKKLLRIITIIFLLSTFSYPVFAVTQSQIDNQLLTLEDQRIQKLETELGITVPEISDNPNHIITFKDPSGKGIKLEIDGQGFKAVKSPYTLPSLGIGKHVLTFKFTDPEDAPQSLEKDITIIPRPPVIDAPEKLTTTSLTFKGTALAGSTVELYMVNGTKNYRADVNVAEDGSWTYEFKGAFDFGIYSIVGLTKKGGFASIFSETTVFELTKDKGSVVKKNTNDPIHFTFNDLIKGNIINTIKSNPDLGILALVLLLLGVILSTLINLGINRRWDRNVEGLFSQKLTSPKKDEPKKEDNKDGKKPLTLREKFEQKGVKLSTTKETVIKEETKENEKGEELKEVTITEKKETKKADKGEKEVETKELKEEKVLSKEEFLKEFKEQDPDSTKGEEKKENKPEEEKKNDKSSLMNSIKISLTSKPRKD